MTFTNNTHFKNKIFSWSIFIPSSGHNLISMFVFSQTQSLIQRSKLIEFYTRYFTDDIVTREQVVKILLKTLCLYHEVSIASSRF